MSDINTLKEQLESNPSLANPEANLILDVFEQLQTLENALKSSTLETLVSQEEFQKLQKELTEAKEKLEAVLFIKEPIVFPEDIV